MRGLASWPVGLAFLAACASAPPGGEEPRRRPAEHVVVAAHFEPRIEWEVKADRSYAGPNGGGAIREMDLSGLASALGLQSQLRHAIAVAGWSVQPKASDAEGVLRLEARVERIKALSSAPIRNFWAHEMDVSWRLVDPYDSATVASGGFRYDKVLSFSLRYDEASGRWIGTDDGRFAAAWARACEEIAARIAQEAVPAITAYGR
jgi:hypothetical protein